MTDNDRSAPKPDASPSKQRKAYVKPAWEVEQVFEKAALGCVKADMSCAAGPIQS